MEGLACDPTTKELLEPLGENCPFLARLPINPTVRFVLGLRGLPARRSVPLPVLSGDMSRRPGLCRLGENSPSLRINFGLSEIGLTASLAGEKTSHLSPGKVIGDEMLGDEISIASASAALHLRLRDSAESCGCCREEDPFVEESPLLIVATPAAFSPKPVMGLASLCSAARGDRGADMLPERMGVWVWPVPRPRRAVPKVSDRWCSPCTGCPNICPMTASGPSFFFGIVGKEAAAASGAKSSPTEYRGCAIREAPASASTDRRTRRRAGAESKVATKAALRFPRKSAEPSAAKRLAEPSSTSTAPFRPPSTVEGE